MNTELQEFFSLVGKAKKEKNDEFKSLVGEINIDSIFTQVKESVKEEKVKKEKKQKQLERQTKALESWLYSQPLEKEIKKVVVEENIEIEKEEVLVLEQQNLVEDCNNIILEQEEINEELLITNEFHPIPDLSDSEFNKEEDTIDNALKILEQIKTKKEVQENISDPEIIKIRRELEYLKNIVNAQGGGGEVRLEFLDDIDRDTAKTNNYYLKYDSSIGKWIGAPGGGGAGTQTLNETLGYGNTSNLGLSVGVVTASYFVGDGSLLTNLPGSGNSGYANTAGIATYATTAGISTLSQGLTGTPNINAGIVTATSLGLSAGSIISGIVTTSTTSETTISSIDSTVFRSATYQIQITEGFNYNMTMINAVHDGSVVYMSEYGTINQPVGIATFSTDINSGFLRLLAYPSSSNTTTFKVILTAIKL